MGNDSVRGNASACYRAAYDCASMSEPVINNKACDLLKNSKISAVVAEAETKAKIATEAIADRYAISKAAICQRLAEIALATPADLAKWLEAGITARLSDVRAAAADLAGLMGYQPPKVVRFIKSFSDLTDDELAALVAGEGEVVADEKGTRH